MFTYSNKSELKFDVQFYCDDARKDFLKIANELEEYSLSTEVTFVMNKNEEEDLAHEEGTVFITSKKWVSEKQLKNYANVLMNAINILNLTYVL